MKKPPVFRQRPQFSRQIRGMKAKSQLYFPNGRSEIIKVIASRIGKTSKPQRVYFTQTEKTGIIVWRET